MVLREKILERGYMSCERMVLLVCNILQLILVLKG